MSTLQSPQNRWIMSEKVIPVLESTSLADTLTNIDVIANKFKLYGVVVLRGTKFSVEDQIEISSALGDIFSWNVNSNADSEVINTSIYPGGHSDRDDREYVEGPNDYVLDWHIEQVYYIHPILAGVWNMETFTASEGSGNTRFVDSAELYELYTTEEREFLSKSIVAWDKPTPSGTGPFYTKVVDSHPITGKPVLRVETDRGCYSMPKLVLIDGKEPTLEEIARLDTLLKTLKDNLNNNLEIRYSQNWQEGDILIVDLFRMYHAVMGGFKLGQRKFTGIGIRPKVYDNSMHKSLESWTNDRS